MRALWVLPLAVTLGAFSILYWGRGYPWQLALLASTAIGALIYAGRRTLRNLKLLSRPDRSPTVNWVAEEEERER